VTDCSEVSIKAKSAAVKLPILKWPKRGIVLQFVLSWRAGSAPSLLPTAAATATAPPQSPHTSHTVRRGRVLSTIVDHTTLAHLNINMHMYESSHIDTNHNHKCAWTWAMCMKGQPHSLCWEGGVEKQSLLKSRHACFYHSSTHQSLNACFFGNSKVENEGADIPSHFHRGCNVAVRTALLAWDQDGVKL
jgi:hypothetical protein